MSEKQYRCPGAVLDALRGACARCPDQRVMQVIVNALGVDPFYVDDAEAVCSLQGYPPRLIEPGEGT